jgi:signal-transduction protein with cAMP-binding, CBS, and nucleotidyltransferase domain
VQVKEGMSEVVLAVGPSHTLREAARKMTEKKTGAALVIDEQSPAPRIITERDVLHSIGNGEDPDSEKVADHMSDSVIAASPDWSLERAASEMSRRGIRHLVVYEGPEVVGVLSMRDIVRVWTSEGATSGMTPD